MTKNFSFRRLGLLIKKQATESLKLYLLSAAALLLLLSMVFIFHRYMSFPHYHEETSYIIFIFGLIIAGAVFASFSFQQLATKEKATYFLSFPASTSEKLTAALFFNLIIFPVTYTVIFYLVNSVFWAYISSLVGENGGLDGGVRLSYVDWQNPRGFMEVFPFFFYVFFAVQAFYIMGSVYFTRFGFIKTTIVGIMLIFLFVWYFNEIIDDNFQGFNPDLTMNRFSAGEMKVYELSAFSKELVINFVKFIWAPVFWLVTYFRLRESQV
jgi:hypothetical protein